MRKAPRRDSDSRAIQVTLLAAVVLSIANHVRVAHHLHPLRADHRLAVSAERAHGHHDAGGGILARVRGAGYPTWRASENLAWGQGMTPADAMEAWLHSPPHRAILLDPRVSVTGVSVTSSRTRGLVYTQDFAARPR